VSRRLRWWASHLALAGLALAGAIANAALGQWHVAVVSSALALVLLRTGWVARGVYRDGWHDGFHEGLVLPMDSLNGDVPAVVVRATTTGCASPEIWDRPPERLRHAAERGHAGGE